MTVETAPAQLHFADGVARLVLDRPEARNAIDGQFAGVLRELAAELEHLDGLRCVVVESALPGVFSVGGDLKMISETGDDRGPVVQKGARDTHALVATLARIDAPVIASVGGVAAGGAMGLALGADLVIAARSARFAPAYAEVGFATDCGLSWVLPRLVGLRQALRLLLTSPVLSANEALALGLVSEVVEDSELEARVDELAGTLAAGPTAAYGLAKRMLRDAYATSLEEQLEQEARAIGALANSPQGRAGVDRFLGNHRGLR